MKTNSALIACSLLGYALASPAIFERAVCNADNCARAVTGTAMGAATRSAHLADCKSYQACTVTPATSTVTTTVTPVFVSVITTNVVVETTTVVVNNKRAAASSSSGSGGSKAGSGAVTSCPTAIPAYASVCAGPTAYGSACSCFGATRSTSTAAAPTTTVTVTAPGTTVFTAASSTSDVVVTVTPAPASQCTSFDEVIDGPDIPVQYTQYFAGAAVTENPNNSGNRFQQPITATYSGAKCDAASSCASFAAFANYFSFDLHFQKASNNWQCVLYFDASNNPGDFNQANANVGQAYGYST